MPTFKRFLSLFLLVAAVFTMGAGCGGPSKAEVEAAKPVTITIWRVFDADDTFSSIMSAYQALHRNVSFEYRTLRIEEYEEELLKAFAEGTGPDVFSVHNTWIGGYENLIAPLPATLTIPYTEVRGTIKKETITTLKEEPTLSIRALNKDFVGVVPEDVIRPYQPNPKAEPEDRIWGLPMSVDSLALFYNKDLLDAAAIAQPPATWTQFQENVVALTSLGVDDVILQSGAAIGTSRNVERSFDILSLLMMQNGTTMVDDRGRARFAEEAADRTVPGAEAVRFYTEFASPLKEVYTWNAEQPTSFDAFVTGKTAFFFGYSYHIPLIRTRAAKLNFGITSMPQIENAEAVNYANYWVETVAKSSKYQNWAWDFVQFATSEQQVESYLTEAVKPPARRALIDGLLEDEDLSVFASQLLTAKSWYRGEDVAVAEQAFLDLIDQALAGAIVEDEIAQAQNKVNETL